MKKSVLVRNGQHQRPMLAVLERYGIGASDQYGRGRWISAGDLPAIQAGMGGDASRIEFQGVVFVNGTNRHNLVRLSDYQELFA